MQALERANENQLAIVNPGEMFRIATDVAGVCGAIVKQTAVLIQGKKYVKAEGWNAIAAAHGCTASISEVEELQSGIRAVAELKRLSDGAIIARAEGFVGEDEPKWATGPEYARRAMAQTRAISRVCRSAFAHVVVLIDAGLQTTPAEEVPENGFANDSNHSRNPKPVTAFQQAKRIMQPADGETMTWREIPIHFGKNKGITLAELNAKQLDWYANDWVQKKAEDSRVPSAEDKMLIDALLAYKRENAQFHADRAQREEEDEKQALPF
jgi:hypothetical protein